MRIICRVYQNDIIEVYRFDTFLLFSKFIKFDYLFINLRKIGHTSL